MVDIDLSNIESDVLNQLKNHCKMYKYYIDIKY